MSTGGIIAIVVVVVIVIIIAMVIGAYNSLVKLDERVNEAWSDITVTGSISPWDTSVI